MAQLKELHPQYITDEEGRRTSVILPIVVLLCQIYLIDFYE